jgi:hypothetical protein
MEAGEGGGDATTEAIALKPRKPNDGGKRKALAETLVTIFAPNRNGLRTIGHAGCVHSLFIGRGRSV